MLASETTESTTTTTTTTIRTSLLPTENFENTLLDGVTTVNVFELTVNNSNDGGTDDCDDDDAAAMSSSSSYDEFLTTLRSRLVEVCIANPWLLGKLEQTKKFTTSSPLHGEYDLVWKKQMSKTEIEQILYKDIFTESPTDIVEGLTTAGSTVGNVSPMVELMKFISSSSSSSSSSCSLSLDNHLSAHSYDALSGLIKSSSSTRVMKGPDSAKQDDSLFRVVVFPTPLDNSNNNSSKKRHVVVIVSLSHAIADGQTYHQILHMLLGSVDRRSNEPVPIKTLIADAKDYENLPRPVEEIIKQYKSERSKAIPEASMIHQMKLGGAIGIKTIESKTNPKRQLKSFVALVDLDELNRLKTQWSTKEHQENVFGQKEENPDQEDATTMNNKKKKPLKLSANDILVSELGKLLRVNRLDTNVDCRVKVLHERLNIPLESCANTPGNFVAMLPFFREHFTNPWWVRKAMTRDDGTYQADPKGSIETDLKRTDSYIVGNLSNWSGFTVGTELGATYPHSKLVLHLPINVTASGTSPFEQALVFAPFQDKPKQLAVIFSTHYFDELVSRIDDPEYTLLKPFTNMN